MRGYPTEGMVEAIYGLGGGARAFISDVPVTTPLQTESDISRWVDGTFGAPADAPVIVLTSPWDVSAAETTSQTLKDDPNVRTCGRPTTGTNGNITAMALPGPFLVTFTGMNVKNPDGSQHFQVGVVPDILVERDFTPEFFPGLDAPAWKDPDIKAAMSAFGF